MEPTHHQGNVRIRRTSPRKLTIFALSVAFAVILSYVEFLLPSLSYIAPGIKAGLANIVIVSLLYVGGIYDAAVVSLIRVLIISLLFGSPTGAVYSLCGAVISLAVMFLLKTSRKFSVPFVSIAGGVFHNIAQITLFLIVSQTKEVAVYIPILAAGGIISGLAVGIVSSLFLSYLKRSGLIKKYTCK